MSRTSSGISIHRSWLTSCLMSSIGKSGARSWGPIGWPVPGWRGGGSGVLKSAWMLKIGWPVPGWRGGGSGVLKSAWMLYHLVGMSFSSRTNFVWLSWLDLVAIIGLLRISIRRDPWESALTIRKGDWPCQYTSLLDSCRRSGCHGPNATPAAHRRDPDAVPPDRPGSGAGTGRADQKPHRVCGGARRRRSPCRHQPHARSRPRLVGDAPL